MSRKGELLRLLADGEMHSGVALAEALAISRAAVWKRMRRLGDWGLEIEARPGGGYRLASPLELLDENRIRAFLPKDVAGRQRNLEVFEMLASTSDRLLSAGEPPEGRFDACLAEFQTAGRGRRGRRWLAAYGSSLCLSVSWRFHEAPATLGALSLAAGVAVLRALRRLGFSGISLKWPNDIVRGDAKLGGVLIDLRGEAAGPAFVVVGVGVNLRLSASQRADLEVEGVSATDLASLGALPGRNLAAATLIAEIVPALAEFAGRGIAAFAEEWREADALAGRPVRVVQAGEPLEGLARGVDADGALLVDVGGTSRRVLSGDVSVRTVR